MSTRCKRWLPLFAWVVVIFGLSSIPGMVTDDIRLPSGSDKLIHFVEYAVFAVLFYRGLSYDSGKVRWLLFFVVVTTGGGIAGLDEMYQSYIPGRDSSFFDLLADFAGAAAGSFVAILWRIRALRRG